MKCSNCPKITSKDTEPEPEGELDVDAGGVVTGDIRIHNDCSECGSELEEATFNVEIDLSEEVQAHNKDKHTDGKTPGLSVSADISRTDEMQTKDRRGQPIKSHRYMRRKYGIEAQATITCDECGEEIASGTYTDFVYASGMEWIG